MLGTAKTNSLISLGVNASKRSLLGDPEQRANKQPGVQVCVAQTTCIKSSYSQNSCLLTKNNLEGFFFAHNTSLEKCFWDNSATLIAYIRPWGVPCIFLGLLQDHLEGGSVLTPCTTHPACPVAAQLHSPASVQDVSFGFNTWNTFLMLPWGKTENNGR